MSGTCAVLWAVAGFYGTFDSFDLEQEKPGFYFIWVSPPPPIQCVIAAYVYMEVS